MIPWQERNSLEEERRRMETLKWRCEEQEKLIPTQPESQREQLKLQLQQVRKTLETCNDKGLLYISISNKTIFFKTFL